MKLQLGKIVSIETTWKHPHVPGQPGTNSNIKLVIDSFISMDPEPVDAGVDRISVIGQNL